MTLLAMVLKLGVFGFLPTTHAKTDAKQIYMFRIFACHMERWSLTCVYLQTQTTLDAGDIGT